MELDNRINDNWGVIIDGKHLLTKKIVNYRGENYLPSGQLMLGLSFLVKGNKFIYSNNLSYDVVQMIDDNTCEGELFIGEIKIIEFILKRIEEDI